MLSRILLLTALVRGNLLPDRPDKPQVTKSSKTSLVFSWRNDVSVPKSYELRWRPIAKTSTWTHENSAVGRITGRRNEIQIIETRVDPTSSLTSGTFRLGINIPGSNERGQLSQFDWGTKTITVQIPYNADADTMQSALQGITSVGCVEVKKRALSQGCSSWEVNFKATSPSVNCPGSLHSVKTVSSHTFPGGNDASVIQHTSDIPLLVIDDLDFPGSVWSGSGNQVNIYEKQKNQAAPAVCTDICTHTVNNLAPNKYYHASVRVLNEYGWSDWSGESDPVLTAAGQKHSSL